MRVGAVTIGQSPRGDVTSEMVEILGPGITLVERGALDALDRRRMAAFEAGSGERVLLTRLRDGSEILLSEERILPRVSECITDLQREGVRVIMLLCTGDFPEFSDAGLILRPGRLLLHTARGIFPAGKIGVLVPAEEQVESIRARWAREGFAPVVEAVSPYSASREELAAKAGKLAEGGVDLVAMDCIGYGVVSKLQVGSLTGKPVLLPRTLTARIARELLDGDRHPLQRACP